MYFLFVYTPRDPMENPLSRTSLVDLGSTRVAGDSGSGGTSDPTVGDDKTSCRTGTPVPSGVGGDRDPVLRLQPGVSSLDPVRVHNWDLPHCGGKPEGQRDQVRVVHQDRGGPLGGGVGNRRVPTGGPGSGLSVFRATRKDEGVR